MADANQTPAQETKATAPVQAPAVREAPKAVVPAKAPVQAPAAPVVKPAPVQSTDFETTIKQLRASGTVAEKWLVEALERYVVAMASRTPINHDVGLKNQFGLWTTISRVLNDFEPSEFSKLWNILVAYFRHHKDGVFSIQYALRFTDKWPMNRLDECTGFENMINLLKATANNRSTVTKEVSIDKSVGEGFSDTARGRLIQFYLG